MPRPTIFGNKNPKCRYQGLVSTEAGELFEERRAELAALADWPVRSVSDGDVFEYLARGEKGTKQFLRVQRRGAAR